MHLMSSISNLRDYVVVWGSQKYSKTYKRNSIRILSNFQKYANISKHSNFDTNWQTLKVREKLLPLG